MKKSKQKSHLTPNEVAELLMVNPVTVRQWAARGLLRSLTTPGGHRRFLMSDVEEFARSRGATPGGSGGPSRVLIVDDDPQVARFIVGVIQMRHPQVETDVAHDGFEAGSKVESFRPHALVLDLMMPGIDGFEVCRRLRARQTDRKSTRLNSSHLVISYAVFCLKKKNTDATTEIQAGLTECPSY